MASETKAALKQLKSWKVFGGYVRKFQHHSSSTKTDMTFSVFLPPKAVASSPQRVPSLYWLSGLTCTDDNFVQKAGAFRIAAKEELAIVCPDTSPRGLKLPGESDSWDFGAGAGFYVNATADPWKNNYRMYDYVTKELPALIQANFPVTDKQSVFGHSMGGHGALISYLKNPGLYASVSAFSPISNPINVPWGVKAFSGYFGAENKEEWKNWDATELISKWQGDVKSKVHPILIEQGTDDEFLKNQLHPDKFEAAAKKAGHPVQLNYQDGYDHSYFFISSFVEQHILHHKKALS